MRDISKALESWTQTALGQYLNAVESVILDEMLVRCFGYYFLELGYWPVSERYQHLPIKRQFHLCPEPVQTALSYLQCKHHNLPIQNDSVDACLIRHLLEIHHKPHRVLRETERVLVAGGNLIICGFNPYSLWALRKIFTPWQQNAPFAGSYLSINRITDWLRLLSFEVLDIQQTAFVPPINLPSAIQTSQQVEKLLAQWWQHGGGAYIILAKKKTIRLTPIKPKWRIRKHVVTGGIIEPTVGT